MYLVIENTTLSVPKKNDMGMDANAVRVGRVGRGGREWATGKTRF